MPERKYAPPRDDGLKPYVVSKTAFGRAWDRIEWAESLTAAKRAYGWTRQLYTYVRVRRATPADLEAYAR